MQPIREQSGGQTVTAKFGRGRERLQHPAKTPVGIKPHPQVWVSSEELTRYPYQRLVAACESRAFRQTFIAISDESGNWLVGHSLQFIIRKGSFPNFRGEGTPFSSSEVNHDWIVLFITAIC